MFSIDPKDPVNIQQIGQPVGSGGEFPMSLAINKDGNTVCVLNGGSVNGVKCVSLTCATVEPKLTKVFRQLLLS